MEEPGSTSKHFHLRVKTRNSLTEFLHKIASLKMLATDVRFADIIEQGYTTDLCSYRLTSLPGC